MGIASAVAWSRDGRSIATGGWDRNVMLWDATGASGTCRSRASLFRVEPTESKTIEGSAPRTSWTSAAYSPDRTRLARGSSSGLIKVWDIVGATELLSFKGHRRSVKCIALSPDNEHLVTVSDDKTAKIWLAGSGELHRELTGHAGDLWAIAWSPRGDLIAAASSDKSVVLWNTEGEVVRSLPTGRTAALAFVPGGRQLAIAVVGGPVTVWDVDSGEKGASHSIEGIKTRELVVSPDGKAALAVASETMKLWSLEADKELASFDSDLRSFEHTAMSPDGAIVATGLFFGGAALWDAATGELLAVLKTHDGPTWPAFSPDGRSVVTTDRSQRIHYWEIADIR
jgi:WD40 repeat protein